MPAQAQDDAEASDAAASPQVIIAAFTGREGEEARGWVIEASRSASNGIYLSDDAVAGVAHGFEDDDFAAVAKRFGATAVIVGEITESAGDWRLSLWVHNGADGELIKEYSLGAKSKRKLEAKVIEEVMDVMAAAIEDSTPAKATAAKAEAAPTGESNIPEPTRGEDPFADDEPDPTEPKEADEPGPSPLDMKLGVRLYNRRFAYTHHISDVKPGQGFQKPLLYETNYVSPAFLLAANWYPIAHFTDGAAADIGLMGGYEAGFLTIAELNGKQLRQKHNQFFAGGRYRIRFGDHFIAPAVLWGGHDFVIENDILLEGTPDAYEAFPDVNYRYFDLGLDSRFAFGAFNVGLHASYRLVYGTGGISFAQTKGWYPNVSASAIFAGLFVGYDILDMLGLQVGFDYLQYGMNFNPVPTDINKRRIAGGAVDTYMSGVVAMTIKLPGG